ncbi:MAG: hypothetical protein LBQ58_01950 [Synergistaceae bacterium]|nr:hypothetical protein [Synergistaceae bacterium]
MTGMIHDTPGAILDPMALVEVTEQNGAGGNSNDGCNSGLGGQSGVLIAAALLAVCGKRMRYSAGR